jgi:hypothetical protein
MTEIADKYITPSGRTKDYDRNQFTDDLMTAGLFLAWAEDDDAFYGGVDAKDALRAVCRMLDVDPRGLRKAILI